MLTKKPANYAEFTELPATWTRAVWDGDGGVANDADLYKWSGEADPPAIGTNVKIYMNDFGTGTVLTYFAEYGWLGIKVKLDKPPKWFTDQNNNTNPAAHFFGIDLAPRKSVVVKKK